MENGDSDQDDGIVMVGVCIYFVGWLMVCMTDVENIKSQGRLQVFGLRKRKDIAVGKAEGRAFAELTFGPVQCCWL